MTKWTNEQLDAITNTGKNIIVSAGAGSGKTAVLTERVIRKLQSGIKINELLILTFTNAAAGEMKERIRKKIMEDPSIHDNLEYLDNAYITTFDSYSLSLVKKYHYLINVGNDLSIADNNVMRVVKEDVLDKVFSEYYEKNDEKFLKLIDDFCIKNDNQLKSTLLGIFQKLELISDKKYFIENYFDKYLNEEKYQEYLDEYTNILLHEIKKIETNLYYLSDTLYDDYYEKMVVVLNPLIKSKTYDEIKRNVNVNLPRRPRNSEDIIEYKDNISASLLELNKLLKYKDTDEIIKSLDLTKDYVQVILSIFENYTNKLNNYKNKYDLYEFTDIELMAIDILKNNLEVRNEIKYFYKEICVDEYQDTNDLQEEFINLIENNNVYMVGDIKQSIYGFRNANPKIFKDKYDLYSKNFGGYKIDLLHNFRSRSNVLSGINEIFNLIMDNVVGGADYEKSHQMIAANSMYEENKENQNYDLEILNYSKDNNDFSLDEIECFIVGKDILKKIKDGYKVIDKKTSKLREARFDDFCIILDRGTSFNLYQKIFEYLKVPLTVYENKNLTSGEEILVINNLFKLLVCIKNKKFDQVFRYAMMSIFRSFLSDLNDNDIFKIFQNNSFYETDAFKKCSNIIKDIDTLNNYEVLELLISEFNIYDNLIKIGNIEECLTRIDNLVDVAKNLSNLGYTIDDFSEFLDKMITSNLGILYKSNDTSDNSVKLMNIHTSKGLEFPICYFAGYQKRFNDSDIKSRFLYDNKYGIITPFFDEGIGSTILKELYKKKYVLDDISEKIRLLYVALTRSKEKIIIVSSLCEDEVLPVKFVETDVRCEYRSFLSIINSIKGNLSKYIYNINLSEVGITKDYIFSTSKIKDTVNNISKKIIYEENNINYNLVNRSHASKVINKLIEPNEAKTLEAGTNIHELLEFIDFNSNQNQIDILQNLKKLLNITSNSKIYKEHEFIMNYEKEEIHGIIDLVIVDDDLVKIVDYKLKNIDDKKYIEQLKIYYRYIKKTMPNKKIKVYLYSILDNVLREINSKKFV